MLNLQDCSSSFLVVVMSMSRVFFKYVAQANRPRQQGKAVQTIAGSCAAAAWWARPKPSLLVVMAQTFQHGQNSMLAFFFFFFFFTPPDIVAQEHHPKSTATAIWIFTYLSYFPGIHDLDQRNFDATILRDRSLTTFTRRGI